MFTQVKEIVGAFGLLRPISADENKKVLNDKLKLS